MKTTLDESLQYYREAMEMLINNPYDEHAIMFEATALGHLIDTIKEMMEEEMAHKDESKEPF